MKRAASNGSTPAVREPHAARLAVAFAAKTTASALIALVIAFTFNLDQPQWALLTVFIVAQPQSGLVLAKIMALRLRTGLAEFEIAITAAFDQWQSHLRPDRSDDIAAFGEGVAFLGTGRKLIRSREEGTSAAIAHDAFGFGSEHEARLLEPECALLSAKHHKGVLRDAA
jgi:Fusaric acid resistance protein family